jgi:tetratricopeptide (TPR) repeat protein/ADP-heptose:LPS heptosyltransferase
MNTSTALDQALQHLAQRENRQALERLQEHIAQHPQDIAALNALGVAHRRLGHVNLAKQRLLQALSIDPQCEAALVNLALLHLDAGDAQACLDVATSALAAAPESVNAMVQQALALHELGRLDEALRVMQAAYARAHEVPEVRFNLSLLLLHAGAWSLAWPLYESRFDVPSSFSAQLERQRWPGRWTGQPIANDQCLLLCAEQGLGDTLQFCRLALHLVQQGIQVVFEVPAPLQGLLQSLHPQIKVYTPYQYKGAFAYHCPLLSLPGTLRLTPAALDAPFEPYLKCSDAGLSAWRQRCDVALGPAQGPRIGLFWRTHSKGTGPNKRNIVLADLLAHLPATLTCIVLQKDLSPNELHLLKQRPNTWVPSADIDDFEDTAALCMLVDVVVSIDTSVAHLAGALGRPCWVLLPCVADWRWQLAASHSPWYGQTRLLRQHQPQQWADVLETLREDLAAFLRGEAPAAALPPMAALDHRPSPASPPKPTPPSMSLLKQAYEAYTEGRLAQALQCCQTHLQHRPDDAAALHLYGVCLHKDGRSQEALQALQVALGLSPLDAALHNSMGIVLRHLKQHAQAIHHYQEALRLGNQVPAVHCNLGNALRDLRRFEEALQSFERALTNPAAPKDAEISKAQTLCDLGRLDEALHCIEQVCAQRPDSHEAHNVLGNVLLQQNRPEAALQAYQHALRIKPDYPEALNNCGNALLVDQAFALALEQYDHAIALKADYPLAWYNKGNALRSLRRHEAAIAAYTRSIELDPQQASAYNNRGSVFNTLRRDAEALQDFTMALRIEPDHVDALCNQSAVHKDRGDFAQALACLEHAWRIKPENANIQLNFGNLRLDQDDQEAALQHYKQALQLEPDNAAAHMNLGITQLLMGQFETGWAHYEWRWKTDLFALDKGRPPLPGKRWDGSQPIAGQNILLFWEQGLGDTLQFARYASALLEHGATVTLEVQPPVAELLRSLPGSPKVITRISERPAANLHCPLLSLPLCFQNAGLPTPGSAAYLRADPLRVEQWKYRLADSGVDFSRPRIGLVCSGNPEHSNDRKRSLPLAQLLPIFAGEHPLQVISLQKELRSEDLASLTEHPNASFQFLGDDLKDFADTAALCACVDLVISVDTSVAHLAAALGRPTWIMLPHNPDWRWLHQGDGSHWYSSVRLYRQSGRDTWTAPLSRLQTDLQQWFAKP